VGVEPRSALANELGEKAVAIADQDPGHVAIRPGHEPMIAIRTR